MIIAISGKSGCGNSTVSKGLAEALGYRFVNYTFHTMADELGVAFERMLEMASRDPSYDRKLDERQVRLAREGDCVIGSRLAVWLLAGEAFTVYLEAEADVRAMRIWNREGNDLEYLKAFTRERDKSDHERFLKLYGIDNDDYSFCNLIVDAAGLTPLQIIDEIKSIAFGDR
jgi:cytidylate kinase